MPFKVKDTSKNTLFSNAVFNVLYNVLNMLFPLISASYVSRVLLAEGIGKVEFTNNIASYFLLAASLGIPTYGIKAIAEVNSGVSRSKVFTELAFINGAMTAIVSIIYYVMILSIPYFQKDLFLYCIAGIPILTNFFNIEWFYRGIENYKYITNRNIILKAISVAAILLFVKERSDLYIYMFIVCGLSSVNHIYNFIHARSHVKLMLPIEVKEVRRHFSSIISLALSVVVGTIYLKMGTTMIGVLCDSSSVGYYSSALRIVNIVLAVITSVTAVSLPRLSMLYCTAIKDFRELITRLLNILMVICTAACIGVFFVADDIILLLFGATFEPAANILKILSLLFVIKGVGDLLAYQVVVAMGKEKILLPIRLSSIVINLIMNYCLIKGFEHNGAAIATVITELFTLITAVLLFKDKIGIKVKFANLFSIIASNVMMAFVLFLLRFLLNNLTLRLICSVLIGAFTYFAMLFLTKNECIANALDYIKSKWK